MASSDDEDDAVLNDVTDYQFVVGAGEELISFANLPVDWNEGGIQDGKQQKIYLRGKADNGLRPIYIQVTAWKFVLPKGKPEISVLSVKGNWIKLLKPWKQFNDTIRTILVTLHVLHFAKWNPRLTQSALWDNLNRTLRFDRRPCVDDLADHVPLISEAINWDEKLAKSKVLIEFLAVKPLEKSTYNQGLKPPFVVDNVNGKEDIEDPDEDGENQDNDSIEGEEADENEDACAICDNGGDLLSCDGKCMRSFHSTVEDGKESQCDSLGFTDAELEAIKGVPFICDNCKHKKHQCFACGKLGSSDELSNPEVFCCVNGACGYFYHPHCVVKLLHPGHDAESEELQKRISAGEPFECPVHRCHVCRESEMMSTRGGMQFAVCRRCPKAYHRKCLPREISFGGAESGIIQRAWEGLIPKRILIYCLDHDIDQDIGTPPRDHIVFPGPQEEKRKLLKLKTNKKKNLSKGRVLASDDDDAGNKISGKQKRANKKARSSSKGGGHSRKRSEELPMLSSFKKRKLAPKRNSREELKESATDEGGVSSIYRLNAAFCDTVSEAVNSCVLATGHGENEITKEDNPTANRTDNTWSLDADARRSVLTLMKDAATSLTLEEVKESYEPSSTNKLHSRCSADQVTFGKVQGSIQAVCAARMNLDGDNAQDPKAFCGGELLEQVSKWKEKLNVYLAPFLCGTRHTSFGRHFTQMDKLKEIVELLHWYVEEGDMLVDFCCGSNDFSCLMKKKVDEMGKICSFRNYDIIQAQNDFNFERRDWMGVKKEELPDGSKLIIGLNPPFGVNDALANKFISKALEFKPKLLILIMSREMRRLLDEKITPYDLIWDDDQMLAGESFYLPESVDVKDKEISNLDVNAPTLCLWSSPAWTLKHRAIADQHSHVSGALKNHRLPESHNRLLVSSSAPAVDNISSRDEAECADTSDHLEQKRKEIISHQEASPRNINESEANKSDTAVENHLKSNSKNSGRKGNKKKPPNECHNEQLASGSAPASGDASFSRVQAERADKSNYPDKKRKEILTHLEVSSCNRSEAGKKDTAAKNHLKSSSKNSDMKRKKKRPPSEGDYELLAPSSTPAFDNISSSRVEADHGADTCFYSEQKRKENISHQEGSPHNINESEAGKSATAVQNSLKSTSKSPGVKRKKKRPASESCNDLLASSSALVFDNICSRVEAERADTSNYPEQKRKEIVSHEEGSPLNINEVGAGKSDAAVRNHSKSSSKNPGVKGNKKKPASESHNELLATSSAPACDNVSSPRVEAKRGDTYSYTEQKRKEIISNQEGSPHDINESEAGKSDTAMKNHLKSTSENPGMEGNKKRPASESHNDLLASRSAQACNNVSSSRVKAKRADASNYPEQKRKKIISHHEGSPRNINKSESGRSDTAVINHLKSTSENPCMKGNKKRPASESHNDLLASSSAPAPYNVSSSRVVGKCADTSNYPEQKRKKIISHQEGSPYNINESEAGKSDTAVNSENPGMKGNKKRPASESHNDLLTSSSAPARDNISSSRVEAKSADTSNYLEQRRKEIISHQEGSPCNINEKSEAGESDTAVKNHLKSSSGNPGVKGNKKRPASESHNDMLHQEGSPRNIKDSEAGKTDTVVKNHLKSCSKNSAMQGNKIIPPCESHIKLLTSKKAVAFDNISSRVEAICADTRNYLENMNEIISHQEGSPHNINDSEEGKSDSALKNHLKSSSMSSGGRGNKERPPCESHNELLASSSAPEVDNVSYSRVESERADTCNYPEQRREEIISHQEGSPCNVKDSEVCKSKNAVKNHWESNSMNSGRKGNKNGPPSNVVLNDNSSSKRSAFLHGPLDVANHFETYSTERLEAPTQAYGMGDYRQSNESNFRMSRPQDRMNGFEGYQTQHGSQRQGLGEYHDQQQFNQCLSHPYSSENNEVTDVRKYTGVADMNSNNLRRNPDYGGEMYSPFEYENDHGPPGFGGPPRFGGHTRTGYRSLSYGGTNAPTMQRYASRLSEVHPHQPSSSFAPPPFHYFPPHLF